MTPHCDFEPDLLDALAAGRWPARAEAELRTHVASCAACGDTALVAAAFLEDRETGPVHGPIPPASLVWWRSQVRARKEAARLAARPIALVQAAATLGVTAAAIAAAPTASSWLQDGVVALGASGWGAIPRADLSWVLGTTASMTVLTLVGIAVVLAPVMVYLALDD